MPTCKKCKKEFPNWKYIEGKNRNLGKRKYCLGCSPFGSKNRISLDKKGGQCIICKKDLVGNQTKFCSIVCKSKHHFKPYKERGKRSIESSNRATVRAYRNKRERALSLLGKRCYVCDRDIHLLCHKKDGIPHLSSKTYKMVINNASDFVRVCMKCHIAIHWIMKHYGWTWEEIIRLI